MKRFSLLLLLPLFALATAFVADATQLVNTWHLTAVITDGTPGDPPAEMAGDMFVFQADNTFSATINGAGYTGTYSVDPTNTWLTLYITDDLAYRYKIITLEADALTVQTIDASGNPATYLFEVTP